MYLLTDLSVSNDRVASVRRRPLAEASGKKSSPIKDLHIRDLDFVEKFHRYSFLKSDFCNYGCLEDPQFLENVTFT